MSRAPGEWIRLAVRPSHAGRSEAVSAALFAAGAQGLHEDGDWLVTHLEAGTNLDPFEGAVGVADPAAVVESAHTPSVDWSVRWRERIGSHVLGALTVSPPWLALGLDPARTVVIEPQMAFGTGEHATTRGVVRLMQDVLRRGDVVADLGAGSAVLAIAAAKLGAFRVVAIEMDPDAIANAEDNVVRNAVGDRVTVVEGDAAVLLPLVAPVRVVLANIISSVLLELLPAIARSLAPGGVAILSGMLAEERLAMIAAMTAGGWRVLGEDSEDQWWSVSLGR